jgi:hypothetical protein
MEELNPLTCSFNSELFDPMLEQEFKCLECDKAYIKKNGRARVSLMARSGKSYWMWFCIPCYEKRYGKSMTKFSLQNEPTSQI